MVRLKKSYLHQKLYKSETRSQPYLETNPSPPLTLSSYLLSPPLILSSTQHGKAALRRAGVARGAPTKRRRSRGAVWRDERRHRSLSRLAGRSPPPPPRRRRRRSALRYLPLALRRGRFSRLHRATTSDDNGFLSIAALLASPATSDAMTACLLAALLRRPRHFTSRLRAPRQETTAAHLLRRWLPSSPPPPPATTRDAPPPPPASLLAASATGYDGRQRRLASGHWLPSSTQRRRRRNDDDDAAACGDAVARLLPLLCGGSGGWRRAWPEGEAGGGTREWFFLYFILFF